MPEPLTVPPISVSPAGDTPTPAVHASDAGSSTSQPLNLSTSQPSSPSDSGGLGVDCSHIPAEATPGPFLCAVAFDALPAALGPHTSPAGVFARVWLCASEEDRARMVPGWPPVDVCLLENVYEAVSTLSLYARRGRSLLPMRADKRVADALAHHPQVQVTVEGDSPADAFDLSECARFIQPAVYHFSGRIMAIRLNIFNTAAPRLFAVGRGPLVSNTDGTPLEGADILRHMRERLAEISGVGYVRTSRYLVERWPELAEAIQALGLPVVYFGEDAGRG